MDSVPLFDDVTRQTGMVLSLLPLTSCWVSAITRIFGKEREECGFQNTAGVTRGLVRQRDWRVKWRMHRLHLKGCMHSEALPGSGHPLNSALVTESVQKGKRGKKEFSKTGKKRVSGGKDTAYRTEKASQQETLSQIHPPSLHEGKEHLFYREEKREVKLLRLFITWLTSVDRICQHYMNNRCQHSSDTVMRPDNSNSTP